MIVTDAPGTTAQALAAPRKKRFYEILYVQVLIAIAIGITRSWPST